MHWVNAWWSRQQQRERFKLVFRQTQWSRSKHSPKSKPSTPRRAVKSAIFTLLRTCAALNVSDSKHCVSLSESLRFFCWEATAVEFRLTTWPDGVNTCILTYTQRLHEIREEGTDSWHLRIKLFTVRQRDRDNPEQPLWRTSEYLTSYWFLPISGLCTHGTQHWTNIK